MTAARVVLHVGQHKTGSKALQSALYAHRRWLAAHGVTFPLPWRVRLRPHPAALNHAALLSALRADPAGAALRALLRRLLRRGERVVLSAEDLFDMRSAHESPAPLRDVRDLTTALAAAFDAASERPQVIVYLRRQDHLIAAHYAQWIKGDRVHHDDFATFLARARPRLAADALLTAWEAAFGVAAITVRAYETAALPHGIVPDFFATALGLPEPPAATRFANDPEARNETPTREHVDYLRLLNRRSAAGAAVLPRASALAAAPAARGPRGAAAYQSGDERRALLAEHAAGNDAIAQRYRLRGPLFREAPPEPSAAPFSPAATSDPEALARAIAIDAAARRALRRSPAAAARVALRLLLRARRPRRISLILTPDALPADVALAQRTFAAIAGDLAFAPGWGECGGARHLIGPPRTVRRIDAAQRPWLLLGAPPDRDRAERVAAVAPRGIVCGDEATRTAWLRALPTLARSAAYVLSDAAIDLAWLPAHVPQVVRYARPSPPSR
jgi:hypothetical protein